MIVTTHPLACADTANATLVCPWPYSNRRAVRAAAVEGARRRPIGQAGAFGWNRRDGSVFISPLVAVTLARFGAVTAGRRRTGRACFV